jgi:hypothetical protein
MSPATTMRAWLRALAVLGLTWVACAACAACDALGEGSPLATAAFEPTRAGADDGATTGEVMAGDPQHANDRGGGADRGDGREQVPTPPDEPPCMIGYPSHPLYPCAGSCQQISGDPDFGRCLRICAASDRYPYAAPEGVRDCDVGWACVRTPWLGEADCLPHCQSQSDCLASDACTPLDVTQPKLGAVCWPRYWASLASPTP